MCVEKSHLGNIKNKNKKVLLVIEIDFILVHFILKICFKLDFNRQNIYLYIFIGVFFNIVVLNNILTACCAFAESLHAKLCWEK